MTTMLEETIEVKIERSIIINKHQLNFDTCETDAELRSSAERILSSMSSEEQIIYILITMVLQ